MIVMFKKNKEIIFIDWWGLRIVLAWLTVLILPTV
tara:strand:+ start:17 stop:121 length:105 start_codon:yes stop_codon:yes gene_type:complete